MTHDEEKNQSIETNPQLTQMSALADHSGETVITVSQMLQKLSRDLEDDPNQSSSVKTIICRIKNRLDKVRE